MKFNVGAKKGKVLSPSHYIKDVTEKQIIGEKYHIDVYAGLVKFKLAAILKRQTTSKEFTFGRILDCAFHAGSLDQFAHLIPSLHFKQSSSSKPVKSRKVVGLPIAKYLAIIQSYQDIEPCYRFMLQTFRKYSGMKEAHVQVMWSLEFVQIKLHNILLVHSDE